MEEEEVVRPSPGEMEEQWIIETLEVDCDCILKAEFISLLLIPKFVDLIWQISPNLLYSKWVSLCPALLGLAWYHTIFKLYLEKGLATPKETTWHICSSTKDQLGLPVGCVSSTVVWVKFEFALTARTWSNWSLIDTHFVSLTRAQSEKDFVKDHRWKFWKFLENILFSPLKY